MTTTAPVHDGTAPAGALTTIFTPPVECANDRVDLFYKTRTCMPSPERWSLYWGAASFYSPGICPSGMLSVASPPPFFGPPVEPGETAIVCCPSGYTLSASSTTHSCIGTISVTKYSVIDVTSTITEDASTTTSTGLTRSYYNTTTPDEIYPIQVRWRESDLAALETHPLSPGVTPTSDPDGEDGDNDEGGGLSGGVIAGIVVGVVAAIAIVCIALFLLYRRRKKVSLGSAPSQEQQSTAETGYSNALPTPSPIVVSGTPSPGAEFATTGNESVDKELRRIAARRARLQELELLEQEEAQLRQHADTSVWPSELSTERADNQPVELSAREK